MCTIDEGLYIIFDYYEQVDGKPLICVIQVSREELEKNGSNRIKTPDYLKIGADITDMEEFMPRILSNKDYKMNEEFAKQSQSDDL